MAVRSANRHYHLTTTAVPHSLPPPLALDYYSRATLSCLTGGEPSLSALAEPTWPWRAGVWVEAGEGGGRGLEGRLARGAVHAHGTDAPRALALEKVTSLTRQPS